MELKIYNSILFKELRPWLFSPDEKLLSKNLLKADRSNIISTQQLFEQISLLLEPYPELLIFDEDALKQASTDLQKPFFEVAEPKYADVKVRFYFSLIHFESIRFINTLIVSVNERNDLIDKKYLIAIATRNIIYLIKNISAELDSRQLSAVPQYSSLTNVEQGYTEKLIHIVLYHLKLQAVRLFFEVQEFFPDLFGVRQSLDGFYINILNETVPEINLLLYTAEYYKAKFASLIKEIDPFEKGLLLLREINADTSQRPEQLAVQIKAIENLLYFKQRNINNSFNNIEEFIDHETNTNILNTEKQILSNVIEQKVYGHERFNFANQQSEKFFFISEKDQPYNNQSIPYKLKQWLKLQEDIYRNQLSNVFSPIAYNDQGLPDKNMPLPKTNPNAEVLKQMALEYIKHFSGVNLQQRKIMSDAEYNRLIEYLFHLIEHDKLPPTYAPIQKIGLSANHIKYTFYKIHSACFGTTEIKSVWIDFLEKIFKQFENQSWQTIKTKFSVPPPKYEKDMEAMTGQKVI